MSMIKHQFIILTALSIYLPKSSKSVCRNLLIVIILLSLAGCNTDADTPARTAYLNGTIWTGNSETPWAEAVLIEGETIKAVGTSREIAAQMQDTDQQVDVAGAFIVPGFIDAHVHFITGGFRLSAVQLRDARTKEEFVSRIGAFAETLSSGEWITGGDWDHEQWGGELPTRAWVDAITPDNPVWVNRLDGHMALANSLALERAGITATTGDVFGGAIIRDGAGNPTGIFKDNAMDLVASAVPDASPAQADRALDAAMAYVNAQGVTSVHHMGTLRQLDVFERARADGRLTTRIYAATQLSAWERLLEYIETHGTGDAWLRFGALKGFVDGSLGSHTAAFLAPFSDAPADSGFFVNAPEDLYTWIAGADRAGLQPVVHAIGDRANRMLLDIFERVSEKNGPRDRRFRIEHAQHLSPDDVTRFAALGVVASMQPYHAIDDGRWAERVIGSERIKTTYAFRSLLDEGATVAFGSDWFVAPPTPLEGIYAAVTRRTLDDTNPGGWVPRQKIGVEEALQAYTRGGAYGSFEEDIKGTLEPGKLADFVVIDKNLLEIPPAQIRDAKILQTIVGGRVVYASE